MSSAFGRENLNRSVDQRSGISVALIQRCLIRIAVTVSQLHVSIAAIAQLPLGHMTVMPYNRISTVTV